LFGIADVAPYPVPDLRSILDDVIDPQDLYTLFCKAVDDDVGERLNLES
jgi:hypothetical protein